MRQPIKTLLNGATVEFGKGKFDDWCVFVNPYLGFRFAPTDVEYFSRLQILAAKHGHARLYADFVTFYQLTGNTVSQNVLETITSLSKQYGSDGHEVEQWFTVIYAGMVAEENKAGAILKKRIKRLGMHQILVDGETPQFAANFSKGKKWRELDSLMQQRGF